MRTLDSAIIATLDDAFLLPLIFAKLEFDDGALYLHTDLGDVVWGGHTWQGVGALGSIDNIEERDDLSPTGTILRISGLNSTVLTEALTQNYYDRPVTMYLGMRDISTGAMVSDPSQIFAGKMDQMRIVSGLDNPVIELSVESELIEFSRARLIYYSDSELQRDHPGELGFKYLASMVDAKIIWHGDMWVSFGTHDVYRKAHDQHKSGSSWLSLDPRDRPEVRKLGFLSGDPLGVPIWWKNFGG